MSAKVSSTVLYVQALWNHVLHIDADGESTLCGWDWGTHQWNTLRDRAGSSEVCGECEKMMGAPK